MNRPRKWFAALALFGLLASSPASAESPPMVDLLIMRPFGLVMTVAGTASLVAVLPWTLIVRTSEMNVPIEELCLKPYRYTFVDPLGSH